MKISKVLFSAVLLAAMLLSLVAPALPGSASPNGVFTLKGTIRDLQDNSIADVVITVGSAAGLTDIGSTTTDANGNFSIANLPNGYVYLGLSKAGYVFSDTNGNIIDNDYGVPNYNSSIPEIDLNYIWPYNPLAWVPHSISGKVWNGNAVSPVGYESVRVRLYDYNAPFSWYDSVYTDANGAFTFTGIPDGEYIIYISSLPSGYITRSQYFYPTVNGSDLIDQNFVLTQVFAISGTITDGTNPIGNVTVATGGGLTATTDSSGAYSFTDLPAATYTLTAHKAGYSFTGPLTAEVTTADLTGQDFTGTQVLFNITGSVTVGGQPLVGALIDAGGGYVATTGADGAYALELLPAGSYTLTPSKLGYTITPLTLSAAVTTANVTGKDFTAAVDLPAPDPMPNEPVEINVNSVPNGGSGPNGYAEFNGKLYFRANDGMVGTELWSYDPSSGKSALVKDIYTGLNNNSDPNNSNPSGFTLFNSQLYFSAQMNTDAGVFIWKTDGTTAGTTQVSTAQVTTWLDNTDNLLIPMNNKLLFMGNDTVSGSNKLWSLDAAGNFAIIPLSPAGDYTVKGWQNDFVVVYNSEVYFAASTAATGTALFKSDGVSVTLVKSFPDGAATPPVLSALTQIGANLFFTLRQTGSPFLSQVWKSDGTTAGTAVVANMPTIDASKTIAISFKNSVGGYYLFAVSDGNDGTYGASELWRTDGTTTALVKDYFVSGSSSVGPDPGWSIIYNGFLYFRATDATSGIELWKTDGTTANTVLVKDINPGSGSNYISEFAIYTGALYFAADDGVNGTQLWKTDGSGAGTVMAAELNPNGGYPGGYYVSGGKLYFYANHPLFDQEMWSYDSTSASAALVADINQVDNGSNPAQFKELNGLLYFTATDNDHGTELWVYDPATGDKHITQDIYAGAYNARISYLTAVNGVLAFRATDGSGYALWVYDPTTGTATALLDKDGNGIPEPGAMIVMDDKAYFSQYNDGVLYVTDGTPAGTFKLTATSAPAVSPLPYGIDSSSGQALVVNHVLYFVGYESASGEELWKTDGTAAGTALVKDIYEGSSGSNIAYMTEMGGKLYFSAEGYTGSTSTGYELWVSDGTAAGTKPVGDINSASQGSFDWITTCNGQLFFAATNPTVGNELWVSDGDPTNATGTMLVKDIEPGTDSSAPSYPICFKSKLFFRAYNHLSGNELYSSNGTEAGTIVLDLNPIVGQGSSPQVKVATETSLYFTAEMPEFGTELWVTDGDLTSLSGTRRITDIDPGTGSSSPEYRGKVGSQLFFAMTNSTIGTELYRMDSTNNAVYLTKDLYSGSSDGASSSEHLVSGGRFYYSGGTSYHGQEVWYITPIYAPSAFTNGAPSDGSLGTAYNFTFSADGNPSPTFTVKVGSGALPGGLTLAADGTLTGTPTATGTFTFTVKASNSQGVYEKAYTLTIGSGGGATSAFTSSAPGTSMAGADYSFTFKANGTPAPTYAVTAGALPDGLTLDGDTGVLSGNATVSGTFTFTITATNSGGSATQNVTLILLPAPTLGLQTSQPTQHTYGITFPTGGGAPTGTVTFKDNTVAIPGCSQVNLVAGAASCAIERLLIGLHILTIEVDPGGTLPSGTLFSRRLSGLIFPIIIYNTYTN